MDEVGELDKVGILGCGSPLPRLEVVAPCKRRRYKGNVSITRSFELKNSLRF